MCARARVRACVYIVHAFEHVFRSLEVGEAGGGAVVDGVNMGAYIDWANIQFVPSRLSSTVAATQFLPIDLPATGTITLHRRHGGPRIQSSGSMLHRREAGTGTKPGGNEMN